MKLIPAFMVDSEGFRTSVEETTAQMEETELESEVESEDVITMLQSHDKTEHLRSCQWLLGMGSTPGEDAVKIAKTTTKDLG